MRSSSRRTFLAGTVAGGLSLALPGRAAAAGARAAWQVHDVPRSTTYRETVDGIYAVGPSDAWAVGRSRQIGPLLSRWDGTRWTPVSTRLSVGSISGTAADDIWVGGFYGRTHHWDGSTWSSFTVAVPEDYYAEGGGRIETGAPGTAWALQVWVSGTGTGDAHYGLARWTGTAWVVLPLPETWIADVSAVGSSLWIAGQASPAAPVAEWDGSGGWRYHRPPTDAGLTLRANYIAAVATGDVWVSGMQVTSAGVSRDVYLARWDGSTWTRVALPGGTGVPVLHDIGETVLLQRSGGTALFRWSSGGWQALPASPFPGATFYTGVPGGGIWTGGSRTVDSRVVASTALYA